MKNLIVKDNALIEASHRLGEVEQRLILLAILKARSQCNTIEELKGKELAIHADEYAQTYHTSQVMAYKALKRAVLGLFEAKWGYKYINEKGNKVVRYERFTQSAEYVNGEGVVGFKFADAIIPMLVELERRFTSYEIEQVAQLSSQYPMRLYEFFIQYLNKKTGKGWFEISLDDLRFRFGLLPTEYCRMGDFKKGVLDLAIKQINENTDLLATYTQKKQGRIIVGFKFEFEKKPNTKPKHKENPERDPDTIDLLDDKTDKERALIDSLTPRNDEERRIVEEKIAYADSKGYTDPLHRQNLIKQGLRQAREAEELQTKIQEQEQANEISQQQAEADAQAEKERKFNAYVAYLTANEHKLMEYAQEFAEANEQHRQRGIEQDYYKKGKYRDLVRFWISKIKTKERSPNTFAKLKEILQR